MAFEIITNKAFVFYNHFRCLKLFIIWNDLVFVSVMKRGIAKDI